MGGVGRRGVLVPFDCLVGRNSIHYCCVGGDGCTCRSRRCRLGCGLWRLDDVCVVDGWIWCGAGVRR